MRGFKKKQMDRRDGSFSKMPCMFVLSVSQEIKVSEVLSSLQILKRQNLCYLLTLVMYRICLKLLLYMTRKLKECHVIITWVFLLDEKLSFKPHVDNLVKKMRVKLSFYYRNKACFNLKVRKELVAATFLSVVDYGDILYMHATKSVLRSLDSVYHSALRFVINAEYSTHHCSLYSLSGWPPLSIRRQHHWLIFIYKAVIGLLPSYLSVFSFVENNRYNLRSKNSILFTISAVKSEFGKIAFRYNAPSTWNVL